MAATAKVIVLKGDKRTPEPAEHIVVFPGGSISVTRTSDNEYWAHIEVNHPERGQLLEEVTRQSAFGEVVNGRIDRTEQGVESLDCEGMTHLAVRVRTTT